jgi:hypothetical protein
MEKQGEEEKGDKTINTVKCESCEGYTSNYVSLYNDAFTCCIDCYTQYYKDDATANINSK